MANILPNGRPRDFAQQIPALNRFGHYLGTITATGTAKDNGNTSSTFTIPQGISLMLIPDAACYVSSEHDHTTITTSNSTPLGASEKYTAYLWPFETTVAVVTTGGTVNLLVFALENG